MARNVNPYKIGLFALICGALIIGAIIWLEAMSLLEDTKTYSSYFDVSVKGLQKDAVVNYRGVPVGRVSRIGIAPDGRLVEVLLNLKSDFRVDQNISVQLREQGLTGLRYLEIDKAPEDIAEVTPRVGFPTRYPVIRSYPSELEQLKMALQSMYKKVSAIDLKALTDTWTRTAELANNLLEQFGADERAGDLKETIAALKQASQHAAALMQRLSTAASQESVNRGYKDLTATLAATRKASETLARQLGGLPPDVLRQLSLQFGETIKSGGTTFSTINSKLGDSAILLEQNLQQLRVLLIQLNSLVQSLKEQPNRLIFPSKEQHDPFKKK